MPASRRPRLAGPVQQMILAALVRLGPDTSAVRLRRHIHRDGNHWLPPQQVHTALDRLVARGYITSWTRLPRQRYLAWWLYPRPDFPSSSRRFVSLTTPGRRALRLATHPADALRHGLPGLGHEDRLYQRFGPRLGPLSPAALAADARRLAGAAARRAALYRRGRRLRTP